MSIMLSKEERLSKDLMRCPWKRNNNIYKQKIKRHANIKLQEHIHSYNIHNTKDLGLINVLWIEEMCMDKLYLKYKMLQSLGLIWQQYFPIRHYRMFHVKLCWCKLIVNLKVVKQTLTFFDMALIVISVSLIKVRFLAEFSDFLTFFC